jgi:hypothetical protein
MSGVIYTTIPVPKAVLTDDMNLLCIDEVAELLTFSVLEIFVCILTFELEPLNCGCDMLEVAEFGFSDVHHIDT